MPLGVRNTDGYHIGMCSPPAHVTLIPPIPSRRDPYKGLPPLLRIWRRAGAASEARTIHLPPAILPRNHLFGHFPVDSPMFLCGIRCKRYTRPLRMSRLFRPLDNYLKASFNGLTSHPPHLVSTFLNQLSRLLLFLFTGSSCSLRRFPK